jgi:glycine/D-amino acid oxidase-like deaminating enzyme
VVEDLENMKPFGYEVRQPLSREELRELEPALSEDVAGSLYVKEERYVRPESLTQGFVERVTELGVEVRNHTEVRGAVRRNGRLTAVETGAGPVEGDQFVIAVGAWTAPLGTILGFSVPVQAAKGYSVTFEHLTIIRRPSDESRNLTFCHPEGAAPFDSASCRTPSLRAGSGRDSKDLPKASNQCSERCDDWGDPSTRSGLSGLRSVRTTVAGDERLVRNKEPR